ncbi:MAG: preprotein translocase subunit SecA [Victivallaceae bacterium]|nr:preprotein translocase subunit SecA [Victivallaceae bacterium]NLK83348.1 preprotein translocase subunit SecA [Lentisphaerota bacterium]MDD3115800.1 preprotein translocase subunit SecA [Victivallaceae bacterium]MDD3702917.1 preprotein translocase subunit SecA [Victivallaceae bacterium]MDD4317269.1 preprotein translocase subunit SecA [Victivallaceae bacterium]
MLSLILEKIFGKKSQRDAKKMLPLVFKVNEFEESYQNLSEEQLQAKTAEFKERLKNGETTEDIMCEAFAVVKNACRRLCGSMITVCGQEMVWNMVPFDVQIMGAIALHRGNIAEMATGEGKTLVATMPLYLNALTGRNCQLVTVNDYLALRDSEWMGAVFRYLGLTVGCLQNMQSPQIRREMYACDITYGTNSEFGFDYLRDMGMAMEPAQMVQRDHFFAIIDEIDSILIDEARTPLIIAGPAGNSSHQFDELLPKVSELFFKQNALCSRLGREAHELLNKPDRTPEEYEKALTKLLQIRFGMPTHKQLLRAAEDGNILKDIERLESRVRSDNNRGLLQEVQAELFFTIDEKGHESDLTEKGRNAVSPGDPEAFIMPDLLDNLHNIEIDTTLSDEEKARRKEEFQQEFGKKSERLHDLSQLLRAFCLFEKDVHYVIQNGKIMIVDEHTGRVMPGRRFSDGLHQALEAKERVTIEEETQTLASITIQNYFRMYEKLAGMTGTAETEANEFHQIYKLDVIVIPTNRPCIRKDYNDSVFKTRREKYNAVIEEVEKRHALGQPILLGTTSVDESEVISRLLKRKNITHNVLNAKQHQREAEIIAEAGQRGAVTVATNMAGRGTDIKLGEGVCELGGLHVIASARHDARRIDRQLRGRCSRQGDPGSSKFYISLEDNLMRLFGSDRIVKIFDRFGIEEGEELQHPWLNRSIEKAQCRVEQHHFSIRKRTLEYDDVMNKQREVVYGLRKEALIVENPHDVLFGLIEEVIFRYIEDAAVQKDSGDSQNESETRYNWDYLLSWLHLNFPVNFTVETLSDTPGEAPKDANALAVHICTEVEKAFDAKHADLSQEEKSWLERRIVLEAIDRLWQEHLYEMDHLRSSMGLRAYAQKDPLIEYKNEAFKLFSDLMMRIYREAAKNLFRASLTTADQWEKLIRSMPQELLHQQLGQFDAHNIEDADMLPSGDDNPAKGVTIRVERPGGKIGRNDICPCGSGKKYKKCCGK